MFDPENFRRQKEAVIKHFKKKGVTTIEIAVYCSSSGIPITVVNTFIIEEMPEYKEMLNERSRAINEFCGY